MATFSANPNAPVEFSSVLDGLAILADILTSFGLSSGTGFHAYLGAYEIVVGGSGFTYNGSRPSGGTMTSFTIIKNGQAVGALDGFSQDYGAFVASVAVNGVEPIITFVLSGGDLIDGSNFDDGLLGYEGADTMFGNPGNDRLYGGEGDDFLYGGDGNDQIFAGDGNDTLSGGEGNDTLAPGFGVNAVDGGSGVDIVTFAATASVSLTLNGANDAVARVGIFYNGTVKNVENIIGGDGDDNLGGDEFANLISASNGDDSASGGGGDDRLIGSTGNDALHGDAGNDLLQGGSGKDLLDGGAGTDQMEGGSGSDVYVVDDGGDVVSEVADGGVDTVQVSIAYTLGANVENLALTGNLGVAAIGNEVANAVTGNDGSNALSGLGGDDMVVGNLGDDTLAGGLGLDVLTGGEGSDTFLFDTKLGMANADTVTDFAAGLDHIGLEADIFKKVNDSGKLKAKFFDDGKADDGNDYIIYKEKTGALYYDKDGDGGKFGKVKVATLSGAPDIDNGDFFVV